MSEASDRDAFRQEVRAWLEANCPPSCRGPMAVANRVTVGSTRRFPTPDTALWHQRMMSRGWCAPEYPKQYGGGGLSAAQAATLREEMRRLACWEPQHGTGLTVLGPVLTACASEAQRQTFLPPTIRGDIHWCQGFSEPGAGSDLASLRARAEDRGDHYLINGAKIWTSDGDRADWMYCLARTDPSAPKREGISFLLLDMRQAGITAKPIRLISGKSSFCEVFFDGARAEKAHRIGAENAGWPIAKRALQAERAMMTDLRSVAGLSEDALRAARRYLDWRDGRVADAALRARLARHLMNRQACDLTVSRVAEEGEAGHGSAAALTLKYAGTREEQRRQSLVVDMMGHRGLRWEAGPEAAREVFNLRDWLYSRAWTIAGGSSEIQLNIMARQALDLPRRPPGEPHAR